MYFLLLYFVTCGFLTGGHGQVPDYETTLQPLTQTSFTCQGRVPGYYADVETGCKAYHVCDGHSHFTYICPRRTLFQQRSRICDHSYLVRCEDSPLYYDDYYPEGLEEALELVESEEDNFNEENFEEFNTTEFVPTVRTLFTSYEPTKSTVEMTSSTTPTGNRPISVEYSTSTNQKPQQNEYYTYPPSEKSLKFKLKDWRSLFYIPEVENNSVSTNTVRELVVPVDKFDLMQFKSRPVEAVKFNSSYLRCPRYCNPKFFLPGTCHPCLMIK